MAGMRGKPLSWIKLQPGDLTSSLGATFSLDNVAYAARQGQGAKTWEKGRWGTKKGRKEETECCLAEGKDEHGEEGVGRTEKMNLRRRAWEKGRVGRWLWVRQVCRGNGPGKAGLGKGGWEDGHGELYATWKFRRRWVWVQLSGSHRHNAGGNEALSTSTGLEAPLRDKDRV